MNCYIRSVQHFLGFTSHSPAGTVALMSSSPCATAFATDSADSDWDMGGATQSSEANSMPIPEIPANFADSCRSVRGPARMKCLKPTSLLHLKFSQTGLPRIDAVRWTTFSFKDPTLESKAIALRFDKAQISSLIQDLVNHVALRADVANARQRVLEKLRLLSSGCPRAADRAAYAHKMGRMLFGIEI